ncbi:MAG: aminopeptidase [Defluviitaleaceae bacterium]|nr:aminopeptidase [Defluviitaleaceae bacterium]
MLDYGWFIWYDRAMNRLQKYAEKTIKHGANLQLGDRLVIWYTHEEASHFADVLIDEAKKGWSFRGFNLLWR